MNVTKDVVESGGIIFILLFCIGQVPDSQNSSFFSYPMIGEIKLLLVVVKINPLTQD